MGVHEVDVLVVGSGFGGSVAALRLAEKGYRVAVLESAERALSFWPNRGEPDSRPPLGEPYERIEAVPVIRR